MHRNAISYDWLDGVAYRPRRKGDSHLLYRLTRAVARLQTNQFIRRIPLAAKILSKVKAAVLKPQYHSHNFGMVGFVKELIDELGMGDITHPQHSAVSPRSSKFRELRISPGHFFIIKA